MRPGTAVTTPGSLVAPPTVQTPPSCLKPTSRIASAAWAVAMKVSRRIGIGVAPAWAVSPVNTARWRSTPNVPSTVAAGSPLLSSTGPCSMWHSMYARAPLSSAPDSRARSRSTS